MRETHVVLISLHADPFEAPGVSGGGGTHSYLRELMGGLPLRDVSVSVVVRRSSPNLPNHRVLSEHVELFRVDIGPPGYLDKRELPRYHEQSVEKIGELLDRIGHSRPVLHGVYWNSGRVARDLAAARALPMVYTIISLGASRLQQGAALDAPERVDEERSVLAAANAIISISAQERRDLIEMYGVDPSKIVVVGRPIDDAYLIPAHDSLGQPRSPLTDSPSPVEVRSNRLVSADGHWWWNKAFIYVGRMLAQKGVLQIVSAWLGLRGKIGDRCPPLWLVGGTPAEVDGIRVQLGCPDALLEAEREQRLRWWGYLDPPGISALLLHSAALLMHSQYEPGGRVVIEAMATGVPVIATPHGFAWDMIEDWREGFIVDFNDVSLLEDRLSHFVRQPLLVRSLGEASRQTIMNAMSEWRFLDTHASIYQGLVERRFSQPIAPASVGRGPSFLMTSRAWDYYPLRADPPSPARIRSLFDVATGEMYKHEAIDHQTWTDGTWAIRWLHHQVLDRPIWDARSTVLVRQAQERLEAMQAASATGCFWPVRAVDHDNQLVLLEFGSATDPTRTDAGLEELLSLFERLEATPVNMESPIWMHLSVELERISSLILGRAPLLGTGEQELIARLVTVAAGPEVLSWDPGLPGPALRFRSINEKLFLDGGCRLCMGTAGRPLALLILDLLEEPPRLESLLQRIAPIPDLVIAWAWLSVMEAAFKGATMHRPSVLAEARRRAMLLSKLLHGSAFTLST
jgi:glycosyltransferase involved in cell wall biosynthesis